MKLIAEWFFLEVFCQSIGCSYVISSILCVLYSIIFGNLNVFIAQEELRLIIRRQIVHCNPTKLGFYLLQNNSFVYCFSCSHIKTSKLKPITLSFVSKELIEIEVITSIYGSRITVGPRSPLDSRLHRPIMWLPISSK